MRAQWATVASDWDMQIFRDTDGDGSSEGETKVVGASQAGTTDSEATTVTRPALRPGEYVVRMTNFAATEPYDGTITFGKTPASKRKSRFERWTLICKNDGQRGRTRLRVDRGDAAHVDLRAICT